MAATTTDSNGLLTTADGTPLKASLKRAQRRSKLRAFLLVAPLLAFILVTFISPLIDMMWRSVDNPQVNEFMPRTTAAIEGWDPESGELPGEPVFEAAAKDMAEGRENRTIGKVATRLNYVQAGMRSLLLKTSRRAEDMAPPYKAAMIDVDEDWGDIGTWRIIQRESSPITFSYYLNAVDLTYSAKGEVVSVPDYQEIYITLFIRTLWMSLLITAIAVGLGFPVAFMLANLPLKYSNLLMILVLLPFWTSLLVRTTSWIVILQTEGVLNDILVSLGVIGDDGRIQMIYNQIGTIVAMVHILLPFMILPMYSVMKTIPPSYMRAARSLGANPVTAFWRVYVPQTLPGVGAGSLLVFILSIGYYITPALVGGQTGQFISNFIAYHMQESLNWGLAAALGSILLLGVLAMYWLYNRLIGIDNLKLG